MRRQWREEWRRAERVERLRTAPALRFTVRAAAAAVVLMGQVARELEGMPEADRALRVAEKCWGLMHDLQDDAELASILEGDDVDEDEDLPGEDCE